MRLPGAVAFQRDLQPAPSLSTALGTSKGPIDREDLLKKLRDRSELAKFREQVKEDREEQAETAALIGQPVPEGFDANWLTSRASNLREKEREFAETLRPVIRTLKSMLESGQAMEPEVEQLVRDSVEILEAYAPLYHDLSNWFMKLAAQRRAASGEILRARPGKGKIDYAELSREHIARYPKIRARLAE
jgi:hypothetical protein